MVSAAGCMCICSAAGETLCVPKKEPDCTYLYEHVFFNSEVRNCTKPCSDTKAYDSIPKDKCFRGDCDL